jgi:DNA-binding NarL/FixJ family response regulator
MGVRTLLNERPDWEICGDSSNGREAVAKVVELSPDVVILDLTMPLMNGFEAAREIRRIAPCTKIVFFSVHVLPAPAIEVGAGAFVSKNAPPRDLIAAIERVIGLSQRPLTKAESA